MVIPTDENLGPTVIESKTYIDHVYNDHLSNTNTYHQLDKTTSDQMLNNTTTKINNFLEEYKNNISEEDLKYLKCSLNITDHFAYFYITTKIHKKPWQTRPIISVCGSLLYGLGKWLDQQLKPICKKLPSY